MGASVRCSAAVARERSGSAPVQRARGHGAGVRRAAVVVDRVGAARGPTRGRCGIGDGHRPGPARGLLRQPVETALVRGAAVVVKRVGAARVRPPTGGRRGRRWAPLGPTRGLLRRSRWAPLPSGAARCGETGGHRLGSEARPVRGSQWASLGSGPRPLRGAAGTGHMRCAPRRIANCMATKCTSAGPNNRPDRRPDAFGERIGRCAEASARAPCGCFRSPQRRRGGHRTYRCAVCGPCRGRNLESSSDPPATGESPGRIFA
jgi:hypothetical protein